MQISKFVLILVIFVFSTDQKNEEAIKNGRLLDSGTPTLKDQTNIFHNKRILESKGIRIKNQYRVLDSTLEI